MREDMAKVIVERPRYAGWCHPPNRGAWRSIPWDEQPLQIGLRKEKCFHGRKCFSENLAPLYRFLNSKVGSLWADVHSEMSARVDRDSVVQNHIWQHVEGYVITRTIYCDGILCDQWGREVRGLYVDPSTGILCKKHWTKRDGRRQASILKISDFSHYRRIEGVWKKVLLKPLPSKTWGECWDAYFKLACARIGLPNLEKTYGPGRYAVAVLPVTQKELNRINKRLR